MTIEVAGVIGFIWGMMGDHGVGQDNVPLLLPPTVAGNTGKLFELSDGVFYTIVAFCAYYVENKRAVEPPTVAVISASTSMGDSPTAPVDVHKPAPPTNAPLPMKPLPTETGEPRLVQTYAGKLLAKYVEDTVFAPYKGDKFDLLIELFVISNFLEVVPLCEILGARVADLIRGKTAAQIREALRLPDDMTDVEKAEVRRLNRIAMGEPDEVATPKDPTTPKDPKDPTSPKDPKDPKDPKSPNDQATQMEPVVNNGPDTNTDDSNMTHRMDVEE